MPVEEEPVAFIARELSPARDVPRYYGHAESEEPEPHLIEEGPGWNEVEEAIAWARKRAPEVIVRLGETGATMYSAGEVDPPAEADYPDYVVPRWPPSAEKIEKDLDTIRQAPQALGAVGWRAWREAAHELGALRIAEAVDDLIAALTVDDREIVEAAALALVDIGDRRAIPPLIALLEPNADLERVPTLFAAAQALDCFDDSEARDAAARWIARQGWS